MSMLAGSGTELVVNEGVEDALPIPQFDELYRRYFRFTWSVLRRLGVPEASIEDAAQEVWVIVHRRLDRLESPHAARSWLFQIARRVAAHHRRGEQRSQRKLDALSWIAPRRSQPHAERDSVLTVETLLGKLDARKREAFVLSELEGWSAPEIARAAGTNPNTVYSRIRVAREELRAGWDARCPTADLDHALSALKVRTRPPRGAAKHCWVMLAPKLAPALAVGSKAAVASAGIVGWKFYVAGAAALGMVAVGGVAVNRASAPTDAPAMVVSGGASGPTQVTAADRNTMDPSNTVEPAGSAPAAADVVPPSLPAGSSPVRSLPSATPEPTSAPADGVGNRHLTDERDEPVQPVGRSGSTPQARGLGRSEPAAGSADPVQGGRSVHPAGQAADARHRGDRPDLADEAGLLSAAQASLARGAPKQALARIRDHHRRFPDSALADLRALLEIKALCAAGRTARAEAVVRRAEATMFGSALLPKMRRACGE